MAQFKAFASNVEVNGETVLSVVEGTSLFKKKALAILESHGITNQIPGKFYKQQSWLDSFIVNWT
jgi:hypothetical protein